MSLKSFTKGAHFSLFMTTSINNPYTLNLKSTPPSASKRASEIMNHDLKRYRWHVYVMEICSEMKFMAWLSLQLNCIHTINTPPLCSHKVKGKYLNSRLIQSRLTHNTAPAVKRALEWTSKWGQFYNWIL